MTQTVLSNIQFMKHLCNQSIFSHLHFFENRTNCSPIACLNSINGKEDYSPSGTWSMQQRTIPHCNCFNPHSGFTIDCSCVWQIKQDFHNGHKALSLFLWLKIEWGANVPDETYHSDVNVLAFFGLRALCVEFKS